MSRAMFIEAARKIAEGENSFSCCALADCEDSCNPHEVDMSAQRRVALRAYERLFNANGAFWGIEWDESEEEWPTTDTGRGCRVLALLFAAQALYSQS